MPVAVIPSFDNLRSVIRDTRPDLVKRYRWSKVKRALFAAPYLLKRFGPRDSATPTLHMFEYQPQLLIELLKKREFSIIRVPSVSFGHEILVYTDTTDGGAEPARVSNVFSWEEFFAFDQPSYRDAVVNAGITLGLSAEVSRALADNDEKPFGDFYEPILALAVFHLNPSLELAAKLRKVFEAYRYQVDTDSNTINVYDLFSKANVDAYKKLVSDSDGIGEDAVLWLFIAAVVFCSREELILAVSSKVDPIAVLIHWMQGFYFADAVQMVVNDIDVELAATVFSARDIGFYFGNDAS